MPSVPTHITKWTGGAAQVLLVCAILSCERFQEPFESVYVDEPAGHEAGLTQSNGITYELPAKLDDLKGKEFQKWLDGKYGSKPAPAWGMQTKSFGRKCTDSVWCSFLKIKFKKTDVTIQPTFDAWQLNLKSVPQYGVLMAKIEVTEHNGTREDRYRLATDFKYYLVVEPGPQSNEAIPPAKWVLVEIDPNGAMTDYSRTGVFRNCPSDETNAKESDAAFTECAKKNGGTPSHVRVAQLMRDLRAAEVELQTQAQTDEAKAALKKKIKRIKAELVHELVDSSTGPAWVSCIHGCCVAGGT
jgi:hypothetical protein